MVNTKKNLNKYKTSNQPKNSKKNKTSKTSNRNKKYNGGGGLGYSYINDDPIDNDILKNTSNINTDISKNNVVKEDFMFRLEQKSSHSNNRSPMPSPDCSIL
jgi:hypothetical protein